MTVDAPELKQLRVAVMSGSTDTDVDHARGCAATAVKMCKRLGVAYTTVGGGDPGPYTSPIDDGPIVVEQLTARWAVSADQVNRSIDECWGQVAECVRAVTAVPAPTAGGGLPTGTSQGTLEWAADLSQSGAVAADYKSTPWNTESGPTWPPPVGTYAGRRAIKFALGSGGKRIEVEPNHRTFGATGNAWFGFQFYLESDFPLGAGSWHVIWQLHGNDTTSPRFALQAHKGGLTVGDSGALTPLVKQHWYQAVVYADFSAGHISVWLDGSKVIDNFNCGKSTPDYYLKCGSYQDTAIGAGTIYQAGHRLGSGYGAVLAA